MLNKLKIVAFTGCKISEGVRGIRATLVQFYSCNRVIGSKLKNILSYRNENSLTAILEILRGKSQFVKHKYTLTPVIYLGYLPVWKLKRPELCNENCHPWHGWMHKWIWRAPLRPIPDKIKKRVSLSWIPKSFIYNELHSPGDSISDRHWKQYENVIPGLEMYLTFWNVNWNSITVMSKIKRNPLMMYGI